MDDRVHNTESRWRRRKFARDNVSAERPRFAFDHKYSSRICGSSRFDLADLFCSFCVLPRAPTSRRGSRFHALLGLRSRKRPGLTIAVSITTLALLAIERFHALVKPLNNRLRIARENVIYWIFGILVYAVALILPLFIFTVFDKRKKTCFHDFGKNGRRIYFSIFGFGMILALAVICFCYCRIIKGFYFGSQKICVSEELQSKRKVVNLLLIVTLAFIVCFTPRAIYFFFYHSNKGLVHKTTLFLLHCNSAMNPVILGFQSERYRCGFKGIIAEFMAKTKTVAC